MSNVKFTEDHEWIRIEGDTGTIGITDYAQEQLGDVVYVELPDVGRRVNAGESFGSIESVKAVSEIFAPASGEVLEVNGALATSPETINKDPYGEGWLVKVKLADTKEVAGLMSASEYRKYIEEESN